MLAVDLRVASVPPKIWNLMPGSLINLENLKNLHLKLRFRKNTGARGD